MPRPKPMEIIIHKVRTPWVYPVSIWASYGYPYESDSEQYLDECFEHDFTRCNFAKDVKSDEELAGLRKLLRAKYRKL